MPTDLLGRDYETFPAPEPLQTHGPARIIAMCNQKGGVGKTTSSINIAGALSQYGRRVLIVDFDPQGAATVGLGINANTVEDTVYTALFNPRMDVHDVIRHTDFENLDIMPANIDLSAAEVQLVTEVGREQVLAGVLRQVKDEYDVIIVDCQPSMIFRKNLSDYFFQHCDQIADDADRMIKPSGISDQKIQHKSYDQCRKTIFQHLFSASVPSYIPVRSSENVPEPWDFRNNKDEEILPSACPGHGYNPILF